MCAWPFTPKISPMAPSPAETRRPTPNPTTPGDSYLWYNRDAGVRRRGGLLECSSSQPHARPLRHARVGLPGREALQRAHDDAGGPGVPSRDRGLTAVHAAELLAHLAVLVAGVNVVAGQVQGELVPPELTPVELR